MFEMHFQHFYLAHYHCKFRHELQTVPAELDLNMKIECKFAQILPWNSLSLDCTLCNDNVVIEFWFSSDIVCLDVIMQNFFDGLSVEQSSTSFTFYAIYHSEHLTNHLFSFTAF